jgi:hypothetical protein
MTASGGKYPWRDRFWQESPLFSPFTPWCERLPKGRWPTQADWNALFAADHVRNRNGTPVTLVPQATRTANWQQGYEPRAYLRGEVQTRAENWHDLFNALAWLAFPRSKAAINALHFREFQARAEKGGPRSSAQDALTLLDESGVLVAHADPELARLLVEHRWHELFWQNRGQVEHAMDFVVIGHSLCEKALMPYIGLTGKGLLLEVERDYFTLPQGERLRILDDLAAPRLETLTSAQLRPLPLLGMPGWWPENGNEAFYGNTRYFRPLPFVGGA